MAVGIESDCYCGVAQSICYGLRTHTLLEHDTGVSMAKRVEMNTIESNALCNLSKRMCDCNLELT